jgi:hypothetical protein
MERVALRVGTGEERHAYAVDRHRRTAWAWLRSANVTLADIRQYGGGAFTSD